MNYSSIIAYLLLSVLPSLEAIKQDSKIDRPDLFKGMKEAADQETAIIRIVDPLPVSTLVQTLFEHSTSHKQSFYNYHQKAVEGRSHIGLHSNKYLAQRELNVLLQDYMPMNEADLAAAMFMFSIKECRLKAGKEVPQGLNACQYHGARFMQDIVYRTGPIHNALTFGMVLPQQMKTPMKQITMEVPPQWNEQVAKIIANLGTEAATKSLEAVDPAAGVVWNSMRQSLASKV